MATISKRTLDNGETRYVVDYYDLDGRRRKERFRKERDARSRLGEVLTQRETGELRARAADIRFEKLVDDWRLYKWPHLRKNSQIIYARILDKYLVPALGNRKLRTITRKDAEDVQRDVMTKLAGNAHGSGRVTANLAVTVLRILLRYAEDHKYVTSNATRGVSPLPPPAEEVRERRDEPILTPAELTRLWSAAEGVWRPFLMTVALTGLRKSEAMGLTWGDIDWASSTLHVKRQLLHGEFAPPKSEAGYRVIAMPPELIAALKRWRLAAPKGPLDLVFPSGEGGQLDPGAVDRLGLRPALRRAGLREVTLHWLRHGYGSILISAGVSPKAVQLAMGHSSIQMTLDVYGHLMPGDHATAAAAMSRALSAAAPAKGSGNFLGTSDEKSPETRAAAGGAT
jgi:integrase